ncbi:MAG: alpha-(1-_3)-arabinofuranosyltransferase domain-containing protein, partial [Promethearchaeota archaeon]
MKNIVLSKVNFLKKEAWREKIIFVSLFFVLFLIFYNHSIVVDSRLDLNIDPTNTFKTYFYTWNQGLCFGQDYTTMSSYIFPLGLFYFIFSLLSNIYITQALIYSLTLFIGFYSFIKFVEEEFGNKSTYNYIGGFLYIFNLYILTSITASYLNLTLPYLILPLQLYLLRQILLSQNYLKNIFFFSLAVLFMGGINPPLIAINLIVIFIYFVHLLFKHHLLEKRKLLTERLLLTFFITLLINFYWIHGFLLHYLGGSADMNVVLSEPLSMHNRVSSYLNVFRTLGLWSFGIEHAGKPYFNYASIYFENPFLILTMYLLPCICFGFNLLAKKSSQISWVLILVIFSIPMTVASNQGIFAGAYVWAYDNIPLFGMFRSNYKFVQIYIFALSIFLVRSLFIIKNSKIKKVLACITLFLIVLNAFPFFTQKVFNESTKIKIPEYYYDAQSFFKENKLLDRVLLLPAQYGAVFKWGSPKGNPELLWGKGLVARQPITEIERSNKIALNLYGDILDGEYENVNAIFEKLNVAFIVQRNDFDWRYYKKISQSPEVINEALLPYQKIKTFGKLDVYAVKRNNFLSYFYTPQITITSNREVEELPEIVSSKDYNIRSAVFLKSQNEVKKPKDDSRKSQSKSKLEILRGMESMREVDDLPTLEFKKINPTKYRVKIHGAKD